MAITSRDFRIENYANLQGTRNYPNPFFDISRNFMPKSIKELFPFCRIYYYRNEFLHSTIKKLVSYPITDNIIENYETAEDKKTWQNIFDDIIGLRKLEIEMGLSYNVLGNTIVSINLVFRRYLQCQHCNEQSPVNKVPTRKYTESKYRGTCPKCNKQNEAFKMVDVSSTTPEGIRVILWPPERIDIHYNEFTGESVYYFTPNKSTKRAVSSGKLDVIDGLPKVFLDAIAKNKKIKLDPSNVFHLKQPTLPEDDQGWGKPVILPAMNLIYYMQILRRGNEAIAWEHVVPLRVLFPQSSDGMGPLANHNLGQWRSKIDEGLKKWRSDANHIIICPIPLGYQSIGGDAKALMVTPELKFLEETLINSLGIPIEFVKGGATWTGSSVSLRIVENGFIHYREDLIRFINSFLIPKIAAILKISKVKVKFRRLRMQDDAETKNIFMGLNQAGKISDSTLLDEMAIDAEADKKRRAVDTEVANQLKEKTAMGDAKTQSIMMVEQAKAQAAAEAAYTDEKARIDENIFEEELANEQANQDMGTGEYDASVMLHKWALELLMAPVKQQQQSLMRMQKDMPTAAILVQKRMQLIQNNMMASMQETVQAENDEADREVKKEQAAAKKEKTKGQTKGNV